MSLFEIIKGGLIAQVSLFFGVPYFVELLYIRFTEKRYVYLWGALIRKGI